MISFYNISDFKRKFGVFLSVLYHNANIELDNITDKLLTSSLLDMFENNQFDDFMTMPIDSIVHQLFPNVVIKDEGKEDIGELYWSGIQYVNIFLNYRIPLKTIILLCPLRDMCLKYDVYHEMNEIELCKDFFNNEYRRTSILRFFRKRQGYSVRDLSVLSNVPVSTIRSYEDDNDNFYKASNDIINSLQTVLLIPCSFTRRRTNFIPMTYSLFTNEDYVDCIREAMSSYLNKMIDKLNVVFDLNDGGEKDALLCFDANPFIAVNKKKYYLTPVLLNNLLTNAISAYLEKYLNTNLVF